MACAIAVIHTIVQLYRLIPVVSCGKRIKTVIAGCLGRKLSVVMNRELRLELLTRYIVEVVAGGENIVTSSPCPRSSMPVGAESEW